MDSHVLALIYNNYVTLFQIGVNNHSQNVCMGITTAAISLHKIVNFALYYMAISFYILYFMFYICYFSYKSIFLLPIDYYITTQ